MSFACFWPVFSSFRIWSSFMSFNNSIFVSLHLKIQNCTDLKLVCKQDWNFNELNFYICMIKNKHVIYQQRRSRWEKLCPRSWKRSSPIRFGPFPRPLAQSFSSGPRSRVLLPWGFRNLVIGTVYHPPSTDAPAMLDYLSSCLSALESRFCNCGFIILGDFNRLNISRARLKYNYNLHQLINFPTLYAR
jgi:hypothetical protein